MAAGVFPGESEHHACPLPVVDAERAPDGSPAAMLLRHPAGGALQLGARLVASSSFALPPLEVTEAQLCAFHEGAWHVLERSSTQGYPPFTALFHVTLDAAHAAVAEQALCGELHRLSITYLVTLLVPSGAEVVIEGDAQAALLSPTVDLHWLEQSIATGVFSCRIRSWGPSSQQLVAEAAAAARQQALTIITQLKQQTTPPPAGTWVHSTIRLERNARLPRQLTADVGAWFPAGQGRVVCSSTRPLAPPQRNVRVQLGFDAKDAPLAFIELRGATQATLRPPMFTPATVAPRDDATLEILTHFTQGSAPFHHQIHVASPDIKLHPAHLGLTLLEVDATPRRAAGAQKLALTIRHRENNETLNEWKVTFRYGDWTDAWWLVSVSPTAQFEFEWTETSPLGQDSTFPRRVTRHPRIRLD
jgi:hypothetical protein